MNALVSALRSRAARLYQLVTLWPAEIRYDPLEHPALLPGSFAMSTHSDVHLQDQSTGRTIPFWPLIEGWPTLALEFSPLERSASVQSARINTLPGLQDLTSFVRKHSGALRARIDLATDGLALKDVVPWIVGYVDDVQLPQAKGALSFAVHEGDAERNSVEFPPGLLTAEDFPDAPRTVAGLVSRNAIFGAFPDGVPCYQVDSERRVFYVCDPPATVPPSIVEKGSLPVTSGWRTETRYTTDFAFTCLVFERPIDEIAPNYTESITCSGGIGISDRNVVEGLLEYAGFRVSAAGKQVLRYFDSSFPLNSFHSANATVVSLLKERLLPQTRYVMLERAGEVEFIDLENPEAELNAYLGSQLLSRSVEQVGLTPIEQIFNNIEIKCGRDELPPSFTGGGSIVTIQRSLARGSKTVRDLLFQSTQQYGNRFISIDANDLPVEIGETFETVSSKAGERLADLIVKLHALQHTTHRYLATHSFALGLNLGDRVRLYDHHEKLDGVACRVTAIRLNDPAVVEIDMQTEDSE